MVADETVVLLGRSNQQTEDAAAAVLTTTSVCTYFTEPNIEKNMDQFREGDTVFALTNECAICLSKPKDTVNLPCSHALCQECSFRSKTCHFCRRIVEMRLKIFS